MKITETLIALRERERESSILINQLSETKLLKIVFLLVEKIKKKQCVM